MRPGPADVLLVGTGLTMVDVVLSLTGPARRPERRVHAVSRHGKLPARHAAEVQLAAIPEIDDWGHTLEDYRRRTAEHLARVERATGDWRPAMDGLRTVVQALWQRLDESEREEFLRVDASDWGRLRHRMPPESADVVEALERAALLTRAAAEVVDAEPLTGGGLRVTLSDGTVREVGWVVNCTGTSTTVSPGVDPLFDDLLTPRGGVALGRPSTAGYGPADGVGPPGRLRRVDRGPDLDARLRPPRRAVGVDRHPRDPGPGRSGGGGGARRDRPAAAAAGRRTAGRRAPPDRPAARPARAAAVDHGGGCGGLQRRPGAVDAAAVRRGGAAAGGRRARPRLRPRPCRAGDARARGRRRCRRHHLPRGGPRGGPHARPTSASAVWSTWSAVGSRTYAAPVPRR